MRGQSGGALANGHFVVRGRARVLGDAINTDYIISSTRKRETLDPNELKRWLLEAVDPGFAASVRDNDILVAGAAFGCGSAMEIAVTVLQAAGVHAVVAKGFSRTYFRNAINNGLVPVECDAADVSEGDPIRIEVAPERVSLLNERTGQRYEALSFAPFVHRILEAGGLVPYLREHAVLDGSPE